MRIDVKLHQPNHNLFIPQFECSEIEDVCKAYEDKDMPEIPMSRDGENCWTPVTFLQVHNDHSPQFKGPNVFVYLNRIKDALVASLEDSLDVIEIHYNEDVM